ncbi:hypothetical protein JZ751_028813 [Albula glossodonta]|uniref:Ig-like domain-containing protein n=1 Tax=Albula glossodonta TaxID=121402 RepID=A0A8T2NIB2_9TELE|nr:hypothetical protein JZ751_028813 [Albula glossodonta]
MWRKDNGAYQEGVTGETLQTNGRYSVTSLFKVKTSEWRRSNFTCAVKHASLKSDSTPLLKTVARELDKPCLEVTLKPPRVREMFINNQAVLDCDITGEDQATVTNATVTWTVDGTEMKSGVNTPSGAEQVGLRYRKTSSLTLTQTDWFDGKWVQCSVQERFDKLPIKKDIRMGQESKAPPTLLIRPPTDTETEGRTDVTLVCLVTGFSPSDIYIMWRKDNGAYQEGVTGETLQTNGRYSVTSLFTVKTSEWHTSNFTCAVKHASLKSDSTPLLKTVARELDKPCLEVTLKPPRVREMFIDNQAVLDCDITGAEQAAVEGATVTWTVDGTEIKSGVNTPSGAKWVGHLYRKTSSLTLTQTDWFDGKRVQCSVQQSSDKPPINKDISMGQGSKAPPTLLIRPPTDTETEGRTDVTLVCLVTGFSPSDIYIMWRKDNGAYQEGVTGETLQTNGRYSVTSLFTVKTSEWHTSNFTCTVKHASMNSDSTPLLKTVARELDKPCLEVTLKPPRVREMFINNQAVLDCDITGAEQAAVTMATVTWIVNGAEMKSGVNTSSVAKQVGHLYRKTSTLTLRQTDWFDGKLVQCSVQQSSDKPPINKDIRMGQKNSESPTVLILTPTEKELNGKSNLTLACVVTGTSLRDVYTMWRVGAGEHQEGVTGQPLRGTDGTYSITSLLRITREEWKKQSFTCAVKHSTTENLSAPVQATVSREMVQCRDSQSGFSKSCNEEGEEDDELGSLWSTASWFVILFLCTVIYSVILSLIKVLQLNWSKSHCKNVLLQLQF